MGSKRTSTTTKRDGSWRPVVAYYAGVMVAEARIVAAVGERYVYVLLAWAEVGVSEKRLPASAWGVEMVFGIESGANYTCCSLS